MDEIESEIITLELAASMAVELFPTLYPDFKKIKNTIRISSYRGKIDGAYREYNDDGSRSWDAWRYNKEKLKAWLSRKLNRQTFSIKKPRKAKDELNPNPTEWIEVARNTDEWRDVPGYEGYYCVSIFGEIANVRTGRMMKGTPTTWGYMAVTLTKNGEARRPTIHKLVALAFIGERPTEENGQTYDINHIDGDKTNNALSNLEYVTKSENISHMYSMRKNTK